MIKLTMIPSAIISKGYPGIPGLVHSMAILAVVSLNVDIPYFVSWTLVTVNVFFVGVIDVNSFSHRLLAGVHVRL